MGTVLLSEHAVGRTESWRQDDELCKYQRHVSQISRHFQWTMRVPYYRPVSNLPFLFKLLEKVAQNQLQHHLISNDVMPKFQSAYRQFHSTETAVNKILNDLLLAADQGQVFEPPRSTPSITVFC